MIKELSGSPINSTQEMVDEINKITGAGINLLGFSFWEGRCRGSKNW